MGHDETWSTAVPKYGDVETYAGWIEDQVRRCADRGFAERFQKGCPIEGVSVESYLHRVVETPTGKVLAGIRFRGGNLSEPFVDVLAATNPVPCLLYTSPSPRDGLLSRMPSSA